MMQKQYNTWFYKQGSYIFRIAHLMRFDVLEGIDRIGLAVVKEK